MGVHKGFRKDRLPAPLEYYKGQGLVLAPRGEWRSARCPFHDDHNASFGIRVTTGRFKCHGCGVRGDIIDFHRKRHGGTFKEAAKALGAWAEPPQPPQNRAPSRERGLTPVQEAARHHARWALKKGFKSDGIHVYRDAHGQPIFWVIRAKKQNSGDKWIRPMHRNGTEFVLGLPEFESGSRPLYGLDRIARHGGEFVLVCEGEKCANALRKHGLLAVTTFGGAKAAKLSNWTPLAGASVIIWPDHDEPGQGYAKDVVERLNDLGCSTFVIDTTRLGLDEGGDAVDWLRVHPEATKEEILGLPRLGKLGVEAIIETALAATPVDADLEIVTRWFSERCAFEPRACTAVSALYRDMCEWCDPDYAFAPREFAGLVAEMGIQIDRDFAKGLVLSEDLQGIGGPFA